jgi:hypothetical protein
MNVTLVSIFLALALAVVLAAAMAGMFLWGRRRRPAAPVKNRPKAAPLSPHFASELRAAREAFHKQREWLEARFLTLASQSGKPRGLEWSSCDFDDPVSFARDRGSGELRALVAVTIRFEAIAGGGMEHVEAVGNLRAATAVFTYQNGAWTTAGRALFNLNPVEAIRFYHNELQGVE